NSTKSIGLLPIVRCLDTPTSSLLRTLEGHQGHIGTLGIVPGRNVIISTSGDGVLKIWDLTSGKLLQSLPIRAPIHALAASSDGKIAIMASERRLETWDLHSGKVLRTLKGHQDRVQSVAMSDDG